MPNIFAFIVLLSWPLVALGIFNKKNMVRSVVLLILVPYLLLPVATEIDLPLIPPLNKRTLPILVLFFACKFIAKNYRWFPETNFVRRLLILLFIFPVFTFLTNSETLIYGETVLPPLGISDLIKMTFENFTELYLPFMMGYLYLSNIDAQKTLLKFIVISALWYTIPMLFEIRMSPQLHTNIYGFFPHQFVQQMRGDGFRPVVFLGHGLLVAFYACTAVISATALSRVAKMEEQLQDKSDKKIKKEKKNPLVVPYLYVVLVLCKSLATLMYATLLIPVIHFLSAKTHMRIALVVIAIVLSFPVLRSYQIIPTEKIVNFFAKVDVDRAQSLNFRFTNEDILLEKAKAKQFFGWGLWGRNRVFDQNGKDISVSDGYWVITLGVTGWVGYITSFGLMCFPILYYSRRYHLINDESSKILTSSISLILAANLIDLLPNASISSLTLVMAGSILGVCENAAGSSLKSKPEKRKVKNA